MRHLARPGSIAVAVVFASANAWADHKQLRDAYGEWSHVAVSENFAVKWGPEGSWNEDEAAALLDDFEEAWRVEIVELGFPAPAGSDEHLYNVYVGRTGGPLADDASMPIYSYLDTEGLPMVVMDPDLCHHATEDAADSTRVVAAHEFFHSVQLATGAYDPTTNWAAYWYWEATADWITAEVYPESRWARAYMPYYTMQPHRTIELVEYPDLGDFASIQLHHYGAAIWPRYLSEHVADAELVRASWLEAGPDDDPMAVVDGLLGAVGTSLAVELPLFAAHNAVFDYERSDVYEEWRAQWAEAEPGYDRSVAAEVAPEGTDGWREAPAATLPEALAYNVIRLRAPQAGDYTAAFEAHPAGSDGTAPVLRGVLVRRFADRNEYASLEGDGRAGEARIEGVAEESELLLVVTSMPEERLAGETFGYRYRLQADPPADPIEPPPPEEGDADDARDEAPVDTADHADGSGCSCRAGGSGDVSLATLALLLGLVAFVRRRVARPPSGQ